MQSHPFWHKIRALESMDDVPHKKTFETQVSAAREESVHLTQAEQHYQP